LHRAKGSWLCACTAMVGTLKSDQLEEVVLVCWRGEGECAQGKAALPDARKERDIAYLLITGLQRQVEAQC
jgi:hypothetical protein